MRRRYISILLVGQSALLREGLVRILRGTSLRINQSASTVEELRSEQSTRHGPRVLVIESGDEVGLTLKEIERFKVQYSSSRVAVLAGGHGPDDLMSLFAAGTNVVMPKTITKDVFLRMLELAALGETLLPPQLLPYFRAGHAKQQTASSESGAYPSEHSKEMELDRTAQLSSRERSILTCLVDGAPNKIIARRIGIAESTVKVHVKTILRKIGAHNRTQAAIWAMNNHIYGAASAIGITPSMRLLPNNTHQSTSADTDDDVDPGIIPTVPRPNAVNSDAC